MKKHEEFTQKQIAQFDEFAERSNHNNNIFVDSRATRIEFATLTRFMPNLSNASVLDIGCGTGRFVMPLAHRAKRVEGIDLSKQSIAVLRSKTKQEGLKNVQAHVADIRTFRATKKYDYVLMVNVLHHIEDVHSLLGRVRSMLTPKGKLILFEFNPLNPLFIPAFALSGQLAVHMNKEYMRSNIWSLQRILSQTGYNILSKHRHAMLPTSLYNLSQAFVSMNEAANSIPFLNQFCAFHIITCKIRSI